MAVKDLHEKPFDQGTIAKLEIFEDYAEAWVPTFVMQGRPVICIFDFFAGTGYDKTGVPGSPIRIFEKIKPHVIPIFQNKVQVHIYLNEYEPEKKEQRKFELLKKACEEYLKQNPDLGRAVKIHYHNEDCETLFPKLLPEIDKYPSLVYLDQNGVKFLTDKFFFALEKMSETDFLYFVSSSYVWRLGDTPEFEQYVNFDMEELKQNPYQFIHRSVIEQLRRKLPPGSKLKLYPFSIKKGANIHGIIFGASHARAVDKFLTISWKRNEVNGEANFDIDEDAKKVQPDLWGTQKLTKVQKFKETVRTKVLNGEITNNFDLLNYVYEQGHIGSHAADVLREMKKAGEVTFEGAYPLVTYDNVHKNRRLLTYTVLKKGAKA